MDWNYVKLVSLCYQAMFVAFIYSLIFRNFMMWPIFTKPQWPVVSPSFASQASTWWVTQCVFEVESHVCTLFLLELIGSQCILIHFKQTHIMRHFSEDVVSSSSENLLCPITWIFEKMSIGDNSSSDDNTVHFSYVNCWWSEHYNMKPLSAGHQSTLLLD